MVVESWSSGSDLSFTSDEALHRQDETTCDVTCCFVLICKTFFFESRLLRTWCEFAVTSLVRNDNVDFGAATVGNWAITTSHQEYPVLLNTPAFDACFTFHLPAPNSCVLLLGCVWRSVMTLNVAVSLWTRHCFCERLLSSVISLRERILSDVGMLE